MRSWGGRTAKRRLAVWLAAAGAAWAGLPAAVGQVASEVRYVMHDEEGRKRAELWGDSATVLGDGDIRLVNPRVVVYSLLGVPQAKVIAAECVYRVRTGMVESGSDVRVEATAGVITGKGFSWSSRDRIVRILGHVRAELIGAGRLLPVRHGAE